MIDLSERRVVTTSLLEGQGATRPAHASLVRGYRAAARPGVEPRVLVTAFHRFDEHARNVTAHFACALLDREPPASDGTAASEIGAYDGVLRTTKGELSVRIVIVPVVWDLAAAVVIREIESFRPSAVVMNGIGHAGQPISIERFASNLASCRPDSQGMRPIGQGHCPIVSPAAGDSFPLPFPDRWRSIPSVVAAEARGENAFLCNQLAFLVDHAMRDPAPIRLLRAAPDDEAVLVELPRSFADTPRTFVHWPSDVPESAWDSHVAKLSAIVESAVPID